MSNLYSASNQWAVRPRDQRFWGLKDLLERVAHNRESSQEKDVAVKDLRVLTDDGQVKLVGPQGNPATLQHYAFDGLSRLVGAPADFLRKLSLEAVEKVIRERMDDLEERDAVWKLLVQKNGDLALRGINGKAYGRIWDEDIVKVLLKAEENGWIVPPARPSPVAMDDPRIRPATEADILPNQGDFALSIKVGDLIGPAGVYASDRDMFVFMVDPKRVIDDGGKGLRRGFFIENSEVGKPVAATMTAFGWEHVCGNHIVWGASLVKSVRVIHRKNAAENFEEQLKTTVEVLETTDPVEEKIIEAAKRYELAKDREGVIERLNKKTSIGLSQKVIDVAFRKAEEWELTALAPPTTAWGFVHGLTRLSQESEWAEQRSALDRAGGEILALVDNTKVAA